MIKVSRTKVSRPEHVRILGRDFNVKYTALDDGMITLGLMQYNSMVINIREGQEKLEERDTFLHETIHALSDTMCLELNETQVTALAHGLIAIFEDNDPAVSKYITGTN